MEKLSIIIPTFNNVDQLTAAVQSILATGKYCPVEIIIINNGSAELVFPEGVPVKVIQAKENLGWEGGLVEGLKHTTSKYVVFSNDDIFIPYSSRHSLDDMADFMEENPKVGALGPSTNVAMGWQNIWSGPQGNLSVPFLIGFCIMLRRSALDEVGGVDASAPGGDDIDLSIRLRAAGYDLVAHKDAFVYHHGFQTGIRVHGSPSEPMGWNSPAMTERTNDWLIRKHGFFKWWKTMVSGEVHEYK